MGFRKLVHVTETIRNWIKILLLIILQWGLTGDGHTEIQRTEEIKGKAYTRCFIITAIWSFQSCLYWDSHLHYYWFKPCSKSEQAGALSLHVVFPSWLRFPPWHRLSEELQEPAVFFFIIFKALKQICLELKP